ncbi:MAG: YicC family protein [Bacteroidales bacterium]|nr:YicC family protein [Bacteroidales bacterium]MDD3521499.1 YicC family protein [Bacteroidales bacterium]MDD4030533.1 YicC family protein [Bacteroidales bacterium]MDD4434870.1 YicC family protein [Bacteroidales bacterium]MDD5732553.1 YicC family protein [Bacteroidales bacterium]
MIRSMTGYGKAEVSFSGQKYTVEIRSVNGKTADIGFKTSQIPREYEHDLRKNLINKLQRGNIDMFIGVDQEVVELGKTFNVELIRQYYKELQDIFKEIAQEVNPTELAAALLRMPEVREVQKKEMDAGEWKILEACIYQAADNLDEFRCREGERLGQDLLSHLENIENYLHIVETLDPGRMESIRKRLDDKLSGLGEDVSIDQNRLEQELIYYLEKTDISEERVRLSQHCTYFRQTMDQEEYAGRKLNFIAQEMGREINTLGSKAAHAGMQQYVVMMKDELEKIKEQVLNVL